MTKFYEKFEKKKPEKIIEEPPRKRAKSVRKEAQPELKFKHHAKYEDGHSFPMRLNKFIAHCGICSRRDAVELVKKGSAKVNGNTITEPGFEVMENDTVLLDGKRIEPIQKMVYILMNKPKNVITTLSDEKARTTVMDILKNKVKERVYPVGRLDRDTTGLLLLTNDGDLAQKLSHPSHKVKKIYHVVTDRPIEESDLATIKKGFDLEDGPVKPDKAYIIEGSQGYEIGIEIHEGRNRVVRRIFEHFKYKVVRLDRVMYAGLTKKDIPRGWFRNLTPKEVIFLKHF